MYLSKPIKDESSPDHISKKEGGKHKQKEKVKEMKQSGKVYNQWEYLALLKSA